MSRIDGLRELTGGMWGDPQVLMRAMARAMKVTLHQMDWDYTQDVLNPVKSEEERLLNVGFREWTKKSHWGGGKSDYDERLSHIMAITKKTDATTRKKKFIKNRDLLRRRIEDYVDHEDGRGKARLAAFDRFAEAVADKFVARY